MNNIKTVKELRQNKYKVRVTHYRYWTDPFDFNIPHFDRQDEIREYIGTENFGSFVSPKGGMTVLEISSPTLKDTQGNPFTVKAEAKCSTKDNYNKKLGVKIALGRINMNELTENYN